MEFSLMRRANRVKQRIHTFDAASGTLRRKTDILAGEEPLEIVLRAQNGDQQTVAITMRTPGNDYELAAGFLFAEGIVTEKHDIGQMTYCVGSERELQEYNSLQVSLARPALPDLATLDRHFVTNSACGLCGGTMLDDLAARQQPISSTLTVDAQTLLSLPAALRKSQRLFADTGGLHAAALFNADGTLLAAREDIGRHNALDKLIGWGLLQKQLPFEDKIILMSSRASYELLQKCVVARAPVLCAVSAPSSLAVETAEHFGITLVGFLREGRFNLYSEAERILTKIVAS